MGPPACTERSQATKPEKSGGFFKGLMKSKKKAKQAEVPEHAEQGLAETAVEGERPSTTDEPVVEVRFLSRFFAALMSPLHYTLTETCSRV